MNPSRESFLIWRDAERAARDANKLMFEKACRDGRPLAQPELELVRILDARAWNFLVTFLSVVHHRALRIDGLGRSDHCHYPAQRATGVDLTLAINDV